MELHPTQFILIKYIFSEDVFCLDLFFFWSKLLYDVFVAVSDCLLSD